MPLCSRCCASATSHGAVPPRGSPSKEARRLCGMPGTESDVDAGRASERCSPGGRGCDLAGEDHRPAMLAGPACLVAGAAVLAGFDHDRGQAIPGHRSIPHRKRLLRGRSIRKELRQHQTPFSDLTLQPSIDRRILTSDPRADERDGSASCVECGAMRCRVDPGCQAADDREPFVDEEACHVRCETLAVMRGAP